MKIKIGIAGYGNIGKGVEKAVSQYPDMELAGVFTRRNPKEVSVNTPGIPVYTLNEAESMKDKIDVMILCGGSAKDLPEHGPRFASMFNTVDSFDTHALIPEYLEKINKAAVNKTAIISVGWDPGLFSIMRLMSEAVLPNGLCHTFWGRGVSQGHSDAIRRIEGVKNAVQYTVPSENFIKELRNGTNPHFSGKDTHTRECYVVPEENADLVKIENEIKNMPNYFAGYNTSVSFITEKELLKNHSKMPHAGLVFKSGSTGENKHVMEFSLKLDSNPEFTASVLIAYARAASRMSRENNFGAKTVFDVPLSYLSAKNGGTLVKELL